MVDDRLQGCLAETKGDAVRIKEALKEMKDKDAISERSMTFQGNLSSVLSKYMVDKMAKAGLSYPVLTKVYENLDTRGVVALLAATSQEKAVVTNSVEILSKIVFSLKKGQ